MILEDLRWKVQQYSYPEDKENADLFFKILDSELKSLVPEYLGDYRLSRRQLTVFNNATMLLIRGIQDSSFVSDSIRLRIVSETYDILQNFEDSNHEVSINEFCILSHIIKLYKSIKVEVV